MKKVLRNLKRGKPAYRISSQSITSKERLEFDKKTRDLEADIRLLNDTIHEIRKINNQIKSSTLQLSNELKSVYIEEDHFQKIKNIRKNIEANSQLLSIRMDAYDMLLNPEYGGEDMIVPIDVYRKVDKIRKCLFAIRVEKGLNITLNGHTERKYRLNNNIELALFIIFENAIKYSPENETIIADFFEVGNDLEIKVSNLGVQPSDEELPRLRERGFRSINVTEKTSIEGSGLGLYLLEQICVSNNVKLHIYTGPNVKRFNGVNYTPFNVKLTFSNFVI